MGMFAQSDVRLLQHKCGTNPALATQIPGTEGGLETKGNIWTCDLRNNVACDKLERSIDQDE